MNKIRELCKERTDLTDSDIELLESMALAMSQISKMEDADIYIDCLDKNGLPLVVAEEKSRISRLENQPRWFGMNMKPENEPAVVRTLNTGSSSKGVDSVTENGVQYLQSVEPIRAGDRIIGAFIKEQKIKTRADLPKKKYEDALEKPNGLSITEYIDEGIIVVDSQGKIVSFNKTARTIYEKLNYDVSDIEGQSFEKIKLVETSKDYKNNLGDSSTISTEIQGMHLSIRYFFLGFGSMLVIIKDLTSDHEKESELVVKSVMINEIHHRIKNNLQTVASLLNMQRRRTDSEEAAKCLEIAVSRILSISATHELFSLADGDNASLTELLTVIRDNILKCTDSRDKNISIKVTGSDLTVSSNASSYLAIIVNELVQNAMKYAFGDRDEGTVEIETACMDLSTRITVRDNGTGIDKEKIRAGGLGLNIVRTLAKEKLNAEFKLDSDGNGTVASIDVPNNILKN